MTPTPALSHWDKLLAAGKRRRVPRGRILIHEGDPGGQLFLVVSGRLRAFSAGDSGREVTYGTSSLPGDVIGEMSLDGGTRSADVVAEVDSEVVVIERDVLLDFVGAHPEFAFELMGRIIARARMAMRSVRNMALLDVYGRMVQILEELAGPPASDGTRECSPVSQNAIATRIGCSREMISRLLRDLVQGGFIETSRRQIVLKKKLPARW